MVGREQIFESLRFRSVWTGVGLSFVHKDGLELLLSRLLIESPAQGDEAVTLFTEHVRLTQMTAFSTQSVSQ